MKECRECGTVKPLDAFHAHPSTRDRRNSYCKPCMRAYKAATRPPRVAPARLPVGPLCARLAERGGFTVAAREAGLTGRKCAQRDRLSLALRRGKARGWLTAAAADEITVRLLGRTVGEIYGYERVA